MELQGKLISRTRAWANLLRLPNLLTVPGDVLVGFVVALPSHQGDLSGLPAALAAALFLYCAGLIMNDLVDCEIDGRERPARPICSGMVSKSTARMVIGALMAGALLMLGARGMAPLVAGIVVGGLVFVYNLFARRNRLFASAMMGLCRAGSVLLGTTAVPGGLAPTASVLIAPVWWAVYIGSVSWIASREMRPAPYGRERWLPAVVILAGMAGCFFLLEHARDQAMSRALLCFVFALLLAGQAAVRLGTQVVRESASGKRLMLDMKRVYPAAIGWLLSALIPLQAGMLVLSSQAPWALLAALLLLFCWPLNRWLAKRFSPS